MVRAEQWERETPLCCVSFMSCKGSHVWREACNMQLFRREFATWCHITHSVVAFGRGAQQLAAPSRLGDYTYMPGSALLQLVDEAQQFQRPEALKHAAPELCDNEVPMQRIRDSSRGACRSAPPPEPSTPHIIVLGEVERTHS